MEQIFYNGTILTMSAKDEEEELRKQPEAVLVKDGVIAKVGSLEQIEQFADDKTEKRDLKGKCLMPAFVDAHSHFVMNGQMSTWANLSKCESFADIINVLTQHIEKNNLTKNDAVLGYGYDHNFLKEKAHPDKKILDKVSKEIPIFILHISAHLACVNSVSLQLANIDENTLNPEGGMIGRIEGSNEPNGYIEEKGMDIFHKVVASRIKSDILSVMHTIQDIYIRNGITTVQDGATTQNDIKILLQLNQSKCLKVDIVSYPLMTENGIEIMHTYGKEYEHYNGHLKIGGYKLILDGSPQGRSAWMSEPYLGGETNYCGYPYMSDEKLYNYIVQAVHEKKQVLAHCNGDAASEQFIRIYEKVLSTGMSEEYLRPVMIHCQTVRNDQLDKMVNLKMIASIFVGHIWYWGDVHVKNFGTVRGNHISPIRDALDKGVIVNFHQDAPVTEPNMLHSVWCAVNRISRGAGIIGEEQAVSVYQALKAITVNAAYEYFEEVSKGSIEEGKRADLVILDKSPLQVDKMKLRDIKVVETIKDGETIYCAD